MLPSSADGIQRLNLWRIPVIFLLVANCIPAVWMYINANEPIKPTKKRGMFMQHTNDLTIGKGLDEFLNAQELYLVVKLDNHSFNPWSYEIITLTQKDVEFRYEQRGSDFMLKKNLYLPIKDMVLFTDLHEAQVYRAKRGLESLQRATRALQLATLDWCKENKEFMEEVCPFPDLSKDIFRQGAKPKKKK